MTVNDRQEPGAADPKRDVIAQQMADAVRHLIMPNVGACEDMSEVQDVVLGALAGVVQCWVCACNPGAGRERIAEALTDTIVDFVNQAVDIQLGTKQ